MDGGGQDQRRPVTYDDHDHVVGPFLHGTAADLAPGDELVPGHPSHFRPDRPLAHVYVTTALETAVWGAELAAALRGASAEEAARVGRIFEVEPLGPIEDDPNVTDKKFPGNPTCSYRTLDPVRVVREVHGWEGHPVAVLQGMLDGLAALRADGRDVVID